MKFLADGMLGKLTRWLRMLGHDVAYYRSLDDERLIEIARSEKRVLLTRDHKLHRQSETQEVDAVLVKAADEAEKLADLAKRFNFKLDIDLSISRCPKCNTTIKAVPKETLINQIPETTSTYYNNFWKCPECGQVYWQGAHWTKIEQTLEEAKKLIPV